MHVSSIGENPKSSEVRPISLYWPCLEKEDRALAIKRLAKQVFRGFLALTRKVLFYGTLVPVGLSTVLKIRDFLARRSKQSMRSVVDKMKQAEEATKFQAIQTIYQTIEHNLEDCENDLKNRLARPDHVKNKMKRHLIREMARQGSPCSPGWMKGIDDCLGNIQIDLNSLSEEELRKLFTQPGIEHLGIQSNKIEALAMAMKRELIASTKSNQAAEELAQKLNEMKQLLGSTRNRENFNYLNREFIFRLREILMTDAYQALKEDATCPSIAFIHRLSSAIWNDVRVLHHYQEVGACIKKKMGDQEELAKMELHKIVEQSRRYVAKELPTDSGLAGKAAYMASHPQHSLASIASEIGSYEKRGNRAIGLAVGTYDSHPLLSNNPSLQGTTTYTYLASDSEKTFSVNNVYGGSPTVRHYLSPEFLAILQAAENNQLASRENQVSGIPHRVLYTNLQNINHGFEEGLFAKFKGGERERTLAIMRANELYPLSFSGMTLDKDTHFHGMPKWKEAEEAMQWLEKRGGATFGEAIGDLEAYLLNSLEGKPDWILDAWRQKLIEKTTLSPALIDKKLAIIRKGPLWRTAEAFSEEMRERLNHPDSFRLDREAGRHHENGGFYFPGGKQKWAPIFERALTIAEAHFKSLDYKHCIGREAFELRAAFQEYVYALLQVYQEMQAAKDLEYLDLEKLLIMAIRACKENIDRGGTENVKYMYARMQTVMQDLIVGAFHSRALSARDRVILEKRIQHLLAFMKLVKPEDFLIGVEEMVQEMVHLKKFEYQPALGPQQETQV